MTPDPTPADDPTPDLPAATPTVALPDPEAPSTAYSPAAIEAKWYGYWEASGCFRADEASPKPAFVVMMPPPNVTGRLHMGHALQDTVQDALTRLHRMRGYEALWMPGLDHAGIATQNVVEKTLKETTGQSRHDVGREAFLERVWAWKAEYGDIILQQKRRMGVSADWERTRFTMDDGFSRAVQDVFVRLHAEGLVYRGAYLVNWCPVDQTALSDEEVDNVERDGFLWHVRYPLVAQGGDSGADAGGSETRPYGGASGGAYLTIATTRPETILGDTALAVHPDDERYAALVGTMARVPFLGREIPVIADAYVRQDFGSGALKITPGHDKNDFEIGQRHGLPVVSIMEKDGTLSDTAGPYAGLDRFEARRRIVEDLDAAGMLEKVEPYRVQVPVSSRSKAVIEPLVSRQWFVRMAPLAAPAIEAVTDGEVSFHPARWENEYMRWMETIRDWTISRQLWWGHRIPVWYFTDADGQRDESRPFVVSTDRPADDTDGTMVQDEDVLDTWFSSWLWPFATLGWPDQTTALTRFHPGSVLVSGYDILFFWIARMVMASLHLTGKIPFADVFITGMVKDKQGRWMSKSLGNGIDPLDMIEQYGADAVRYSLTILCAQGQDIKLEPTKFEMGRNFANKVWNAANVFWRFVETGADGRAARSHVRTRPFEALALHEQWLLTRLHDTIAATDEALARYRVNEALAHVYDLVWRDYCDWYLELAKPAPGPDGAAASMDGETLALSIEVYEQMMALLHPFMPFITEEMWQRLRPVGAGRGDGLTLARAAWPAANGAERDGDALRTFGLVQDIVGALRSVRADYNVAPSTDIEAVVNVPADDPALVTALRQNAATIARLARAPGVTIGSGQPKPPASAAVVVGRAEVFVPLAGIIDLAAERARLDKEIARKTAFADAIDRKLASAAFAERAPADVVAKERQKRADAEAEIALLQANLADLG